MRIRLAAVALLVLVPGLLGAATVTVNGKLVDRQCSVEDVLQRQPLAERYCTLTYEETRVVFGVTYTKRFTVYCPNKTIDGLFRGAYETCADASAIQIRHPTLTYTAVGDLRTEAERADGRGDILGNSFSY